MVMTPQPTTPHPIGIPGTPWGDADKAAWLAAQRVKRSYEDEVVKPLKAHLPMQGELIQYGVLDYASIGLGTFPLFAMRSRHWMPDLPVVLVTGGVHGYETSGVHGALQWIAEEFDRHTGALNLLVLPCLSPWGYETINRWNPNAVDPNRQFKAGGLSAEAALAMACVAAYGGRVDLHVDLHETTDTDNSEFGPAKAARDGVAFDWHEIPDGFYLVAERERPVPEFQRAVIDAVRAVTHIARSDAQGHLIGAPVQQEGVMVMGKRASGLCGGMTDARFVTTTEVYPDSPSTSAAECNDAQVAAVRAAIDYLQRAGSDGLEPIGVRLSG